MVEPHNTGPLAQRDTPAAGRLPFTRTYPPDAELARLVSAFERGDYRAVREEAPRLAERTASAEVRTAALDLRRRIDADPMQVRMLLLTFALLAFLTAWFYLHAH